MSRKHYQVLADALQAYLTMQKLANEDCAATLQTIAKLCILLPADNPHFDKQRFTKACGL
jgi:hypothetical protein